MGYNVSENMSIGDATMGISIRGIENYKQEVQYSMNDVKQEVRDIQIIVDAVGKGWNGAAAQKFVNNLEKSTDKCCEALDSITKAMDALFQVIKNGMIKQDEEMIEDGDMPF